MDSEASQQQRKQKARQLLSPKMVLAKKNAPDQVGILFCSGLSKKINVFSFFLF